MRRTNELQMLGAYVHGALSALHTLGIVYNVRRKNWSDAVVHGAWLIYDIHATHKHWRQRFGGN